MRGETNHIVGVPQAVAVMDLALGGVHAELGNDVFAWFEAPKPVAPRAGAVVNVAPLAAPLMASATLPPARRDTVEMNVSAKVLPKAVEEAGQVWSEGEAGGVVLVVQGGMPDSRCVALARAMMAAIGVQGLPVGWVGYSGKIEAKLLIDAVRGHAPQQVLVLGQSPLGVLLGRNLGVEGWHAAETKDVPGWDGILAGVAVGVTYPLDLLMKQPLFKRLAWHHLLVWGETHRLGQSN